MGDDPDRRSQILDAALEQFAAHGYRGATIKSIARSAGLRSPALIYWYFATKEALFAGVIERHAPFLQALADPAPLLDRPPHEVLPMLARTYLSTCEQPLAQRLFHLIVPEVLRQPAVADQVAGRIMVRVLAFLSAYLSHQIALGTLRPHDTRSSARAFIGMLVPQALGMLAIPALRADGLSNDTHIATAVGLFLRGLAAEE